MPTREQVRSQIEAGVGYEEAGRRLGVPAGQAYLIATGVPADGSGSLTPEQLARPGFIRGGVQELLGVAHHNPSEHPLVEGFVRARVEADEPMRAAARARGVPDHAR